MNDKELLGIIYHEIGHLKFNHLKKIYMVNLTIVSLSYFLFFGRYLMLSPDTGVFSNVLTVAFTGAIMGFLIFYFPGKLQYRLELEADSYAGAQVGKDDWLLHIIPFLVIVLYLINYIKILTLKK